MIQMPAAPDERRLYATLLNELGVPFYTTERIATLEQLAHGLEPVTHLVRADITPIRQRLLPDHQPSPFAVQRRKRDFRHEMYGEADEDGTTAKRGLTHRIAAPRRTYAWGMDATEVYQFRCALRQISPKIWRRFQMLSTSSLAELHAVLQVLFGWSDEFLHRCRIRNHWLGEYRPGGQLFFGDPHEMALKDFGFRIHERFLYEYNFYDAWQLEIRFEQALPIEPRRVYPVCVSGAHRAPPEDCGGAEAFMDRWHHRLEPVRTRHAARVVRRVRELLERSDLDAHELREAVRGILRDRPRPEFDRAADNAQLQRLAADGLLTLRGDPHERSDPIDHRFR